jgi:hypothetical protein
LVCASPFSLFLPSPPSHQHAPPPLQFTGHSSDAYNQYNRPKKGTLTNIRDAATRGLPTFAPLPLPGIVAASPLSAAPTQVLPAAPTLQLSPSPTGAVVASPPMDATFLQALGAINAASLQALFTNRHTY